MNYPIIIAAFGTTSRARETYAIVDEKLKERFPDHEIYWAFNSRTVRHRLKQKSVDLPSPSDILEHLCLHGAEWTVIQSFNMICGHEFQRLKDDTLNGPLRVSVGHSLLCSPDDYMAVARSLSHHFEVDRDEAVVVVGHGTDHCAWTAYPALEHFLENLYGERAFVGVIEGEYQECASVVKKVSAAGFRKVRLVPLMLVAGVHMAEDLSGPEDSWVSAFEEHGIHVSLVMEGLGANPGIIEIFGDHIQSALSVIPHNGKTRERDGNE